MDDYLLVPLAVIGTTVAFYVGFKNNSAYDSMWEARKIWGAIINTSRMCSTNVRAYVSNQFTDENYSDTQFNKVVRSSFTGTSHGYTD